MIEAEARALGLVMAARTFLLAVSERAEHEQLLERAIAAHRGTRLAAGDVGYGIVVGAFDDAADAVAAALAAHGEGDGLPAVRMAVHTGEVVLSAVDASPTLDRGLALLAIGFGGQLVLSGTSARSLTDRLPDNATLVDRGVHHLHDFGRPEHVWQLVSDETTSKLSPLRSLSTCRHNLPTHLTPLIGRRGDIHDVGRLVGGERLVTITGPGGVGKTRLAIGVAAATMPRFPGGVWWVELAAVTTGDGAARAALTVLGAAEGPGVPAAMQLAAALGDEASLLVLDNCEHLIDDCSELVAGVLARNPTATVLATSREPLAVPGEVTWRVPSLDPPQADGKLDGAGLYRSAAARLFVDRALRAQPTLVLDADGTRAVAQICHRLDGVPLAIELAAARCRHLHTSQISRELDDRFRLLTGSSRTTVARHQTMAASVQWSHDRLDVAEQRTFRRLGVFAGPFPLEAARTVVAGAGDVEADGVFDMITRLVDKSMVVAEVGVHGEPRYRLLETLRAYAAERAAEAGEVEHLQELNARWWASWLDHHFDELHADHMLERVDEVHDNLVAALDWSVRDPELGLFLLARLLRSWWILSRTGDAMKAIDLLLTSENLEAHPRAWVEAAGFAAGLMMMFRSHSEARALLDVAGQAAASLGDEFQVTFFGWLTEPQLHQRLRELASQRGDRYVEAMAVIANGNVLINDDPHQARIHLAEAHRIAGDQRSTYLTNLVLWDEARAARDVGELAQGITLAQQLACGRSIRGVYDGVGLLGSIGLLAMDENALRLAIEVSERRLPNLPGANADLEQARTQLRALTVGGRASVPPDFEAIPWGNGSLWFCCREAIDAGEADRALLIARAKARPTTFGRAVVAAIEAAATGDDEGWHEALRLAVEKGLRPIAVDALEGLAVAATRREHWTDCLRLFAAADRLREETGYRWRFRFEREIIEPARAAAVAALGTDAEQAAAASALEWHEAAAYAARARGRRQRPRHGWDSLTPTELQVAELVAEGLSNPQIAQRLLMGRATVKSHLEHVFTKLGVSSRAELAAVVVRQRQP